MTFSPAELLLCGWNLGYVMDCWIWDNIAWNTRAARTAGPRTKHEALAAWKDQGPKMLNTLPWLA